jgi:hypothetical protein
MRGRGRRSRLHPRLIWSAVARRVRNWEGGRVRDRGGWGRARSLLLLLLLLGLLDSEPPDDGRRVGLIWSLGRIELGPFAHCTAARLDRSEFLHPSSSSMTPASIPPPPRRPPLIPSQFPRESIKKEENSCAPPFLPT